MQEAKFSRNSMKITGTRSYIDVDFGDKSVRIEGELTAEPAFYATISSIKYWKTTSGVIPINNEDRGWIVAQIRRQSNPQFEIIFED